MSDFFEAQFFGDRNVFSTASISVVVDTKSYLTIYSTNSVDASGGLLPAAVPYDLAAMTYGVVVQGTHEYQMTNPYVPSTAEVDAATTALAAAQALYETASSDVDAKSALAVAAKATARESEIQFQALWDAGLSATMALSCAQAFGNQALQDAKRAALTLANNAAYEYQHGTLATDSQASAVALGQYQTARSMFSGAGSNLIAAKGGLASAQANYALDSANNPQQPIPVPPVHPPPGYTPPPTPKIDHYVFVDLQDTLGGYPTGISLVAAGTEVDQHTTSSGGETDDSSSASTIKQMNGRYRLSFILTDAQYQLLQAISPLPAFHLPWKEWTITYQAKSTTSDRTTTTQADDAVEPTLSGVNKEETLSLSDATQRDDGTWLFASAEYDIPAPGGPATFVGIGGLMRGNATTVTTIRAGGRFRRNGWPENTTAAGAVVAKRYLNLTLAPTSAAPPGSDYAGGMVIQENHPTPENYGRIIALATDSTQTILDGVADPAVDLKLRSGQLPQSLTPVGLSSQIISATEKVLGAVPGLRVSYSEEEPPSLIQGRAQGAAQFPDDELAPAAPFLLDVSGAINDVAANGDYAACQVMRYKVTYRTDGFRYSDPTWTDTFEVTRRVHDLSTGHFTDSALSLSATFISSGYSDGSAESATPGFVASTELVGITTDRDWRTEELPDDRTMIEILGSKCASADAHGIGPITLGWASQAGD